MSARISFQSTRAHVPGLSLSLDREPSQADVRELLEYTPETGIFVWRERKGQSASTRPWANKIWNAKFAGKPAGNLAGGYLHITIFGQGYRAHRLAWLYVHGVMPEGLIDHISHDKSDNRIANIRIVDAIGNARNRKPHRHNKSGVAGVRFEPETERWIALIRDAGRTINLGRFTEFEAAVDARKAAERRLGYHPNHGADPA